MHIFPKHIYQKFLLASTFFCIPALIYAGIPDNYYQEANGKSSAELKTALYKIIRTHTQLNYDDASRYFTKTDWNSAGYFWDMYSNIKQSSWSGLNREHSLPKSWWSDAPATTVAYSDLHNLYPSNAVANEAKSNYPLGEVSQATIFDNGAVKVGQNGFSGYSGIAFEPGDEYKGDFARDYMYMATCYENYSGMWRSVGASSMLITNSTYPTFRDWAINLLLKWHRQDEVSSKETNRNETVYSYQQNRNPFIDHPELAEYIWGKYKGLAWYENSELPAEESSFNIYYFKGEPGHIKVSLGKPEKSTYFIRDLRGQEIQTGCFDSEGNLYIKNTATGIYLLEVYAASHHRYVSKIIVEN